MGSTQFEAALDRTGRESLELLAKEVGTYRYASAFIAVWCARRNLAPGSLEESEKEELSRLCDGVLRGFESLREALDASPLERALSAH